jgi:hypothetical protein
MSLQAERELQEEELKGQSGHLVLRFRSCDHIEIAREPLPELPGAGSASFSPPPAKRWGGEEELSRNQSTSGSTFQATSMGLSLPLPLFAGETASALRVHHAGRKLGDVARGSSAMPATFYPPLEGLEGEGRSRSERGGVISPRAQMYRFRRPWAGSGTTETPPRGQTVTPPRPHRRCGASSAADDPPPPGPSRGG